MGARFETCMDNYLYYFKNTPKYKLIYPFLCVCVNQTKNLILIINIQSIQNKQRRNKKLTNTIRQRTCLPSNQMGDTALAKIIPR